MHFTSSDPAAVPYLLKSMARDKEESILHSDNWGVKKGNSYSLLVMIDWTGTYIITYDIIFDIENFPKEGYKPLKPN